MNARDYVTHPYDECMDEQVKLVEIFLYRVIHTNLEENEIISQHFNLQSNNANFISDRNHVIAALNKTLNVTIPLNRLERDLKPRVEEWIHILSSATLESFPEKHLGEEILNFFPSEDPQTEQIISEIYHTWQLLIQYRITHEIGHNKKILCKNDIYRQVMLFLMDNRNKIILPMLASSMENLLEISSSIDYVYLVRILNQSLQIELIKDDFIEIKHFDMESAKKLWYVSTAVKISAEAMNGQSAYNGYELNNISADLSFFALIHYGMSELENYISKTRNGYFYSRNPDEFTSRLCIAEKIRSQLIFCRSKSTLHGICNQIQEKNTALKENFPVSALPDILDSIKRKIHAWLMLEYNDEYKNPTQLFQFILHRIKFSISVAVIPTRYSWYGHEIMRKELRNMCMPYPSCHTLKDELIGKLYVAAHDPYLDDETKCHEMNFLYEKTKNLMTNNLQTRETFFTHQNSMMENTSRYEKIWNNMMNEVPDCDSCNDIFQLDNKRKFIATLALLHDYVKSYNHLNPFKYTQISLVKNALKEFSKNQNSSVQDVIDYFSSNLQWNITNPDGSLMRRLNFIVSKTNCRFTVCLKDVASDQDDGKKLSI